MRIIKAILIVLVLAFVCTPAYGQGGGDDPPGSDKWEFIVVPYLWIIGLDGDVTVKGNTSEVDVSFSDLLENLDFAGQAHLEAWKGRFGVLFDPMYAEMSADGDIGPLDIDVDVEFSIVELAALYRLTGRSPGKNEKRNLSVDVFAGGRWTYLKSELDIEGPLGIIDLTVEKSKDWLDLMIGARIIADLSERCSVVVRGDIGGFGIGSSSNFTWNAVGLIGYDVSRNKTLYAGYRYLDVDYDDGSGTSLFEYEVTTSGPLVGLAFRF